MKSSAGYPVKPGSTLASHRPWYVAAIIALLACSGWALSSGAVHADQIITNAKVYTVNSGQPWAEAVAIQGEKILAVGSAEDIARYRGPATRMVDAGGRLVLPGFTDCHIHFLDGSLALEQAQMEGAATIKEIQTRLRAYAAAHPAAPWILGRGWSYEVFAPSGLPDKKYLDEVVPDRPVYLEGFDSHTWWANTRALTAAGVSKRTPDPANGSFVRDPKTGEPTGAIKEDAADDVMRRVIPAPSRSEMFRALRAGMREANQVGIVRAIIVDGLYMKDGDFRSLDVYDQLRRAGELTVRVYVARRINPPEITPQVIKEVEDAKNLYHDEWIAAGAAKFFLDGVIESHTAAMLEPYSDDPSQSGRLFWDPAKYEQAVTELDARGLQVFTHAIGDRAIRLALDAYEAAHETNETTDSRDRIEHIESASAADIPRFGKLGVIASMQPLHAYPDDDTLKVWARNAGPDRASRGWAWHSILSGGGRLAFGSDWPVVTINPWPGVQNALTRQTTEGNPPGGWLPNERLPLEQTLEAYTLGAAYAGKREKTEGSIEPGKVADMIIVSQNLFEIPANKIGETKVLMTMVGGKTVYESAEWKSGRSGPEAKR